MIDSCKTRFVATVAAIKRRFAAESGMRRQPIRDGISENLQTERKKADSIGFDEDGNSARKYGRRTALYSGNDAANESKGVKPGSGFPIWSRKALSNKRDPAMPTKRL